MAIIGFNFTKIAAQKLENKSGKIKIANNIGISKVESSKFAGDSKREAVNVSFRFDCLYEPKAAHLQFEGAITLLLAKATADELVKGWEEKKAPAAQLTAAMNHVLERCNIQAIVLSRDLGLPSPVPLPKVSVNAGSIKPGSAKTTAVKGAKTPDKTAKK